MDRRQIHPVDHDAPIPPCTQRRPPGWPLMELAFGVLAQGVVDLGIESVPWGPGFTVFFDPVRDELQRREAVSLTGVPDRDLLRTLSELPSDLPVLRDSLTAVQIRRLRRAQVGVCEVGRHEVVRRLVPAVRLKHVTLLSGPSVTAIHQLSQYAPFMSRTLVSSRDRVSAPVITEAQRLGVGVCTVDGHQLIDAMPFRPSRHTPAAWHFVERVTDRVLGG